MSNQDPLRWSADPDAPRTLAELLRAARHARPTASQKAAVAAHLGVLGHASWWGVAAIGLTVMAVAGGGAFGVAAGNSAFSENSGESTPPGLVSAAADAVDSDAVRSAETGHLGADRLEASPSTEASSLESEAQRSMEVAAASASDSELLAAKAARASEQTRPKLQSRPRAQGAELPAPTAGSVKPSETQLLSAARGALRESPLRALELLAQHEGLYPRGVLAQEREVLRVRALKAAGQDAAALARARDFRNAHPDSVHSTD